MVAIHRAHFGRGPRATRTIFADDIVVCVMNDVFTDVEKTLIEAGDQERVRETRLLHQMASADAICEPVERLTGREHRSLRELRPLRPRHGDRNVRARAHRERLGLRQLGSVGGCEAEYLERIERLDVHLAHERDNPPAGRPLDDRGEGRSDHLLERLSDPRDGVALARVEERLFGVRSARRRGRRPRSRPRDGRGWPWRLRRSSPRGPRRTSRAISDSTSPDSTAIAVYRCPVSIVITIRDSLSSRTERSRTRRRRRC